LQVETRELGNLAYQWRKKIMTTITYECGYLKINGVTIDTDDYDIPNWDIHLDMPYLVIEGEKVYSYGSRHTKAYLKITTAIELTDKETKDIRERYPQEWKTFEYLSRGKSMRGDRMGDIVHKSPGQYKKEVCWSNEYGDLWYEESPPKVENVNEKLEKALEEKRDKFFSSWVVQQWIDQNRSFLESLA